MWRAKKKLRFSGKYWCSSEDLNWAPSNGNSISSWHLFSFIFVEVVAVTVNNNMTITIIIVIMVLRGSPCRIHSVSRILSLRTSNSEWTKQQYGVELKTTKWHSAVKCFAVDFWWWLDDMHRDTPLLFRSRCCLMLTTAMSLSATFYGFMLLRSTFFVISGSSDVRLCCWLARWFNAWLLYHLCCLWVVYRFEVP